MKLKLVLAASAVVFAAPIAMSASAQQANVYINGGYTKFDANGADPDAITGRVGVGFGRYFAVEGEASFGLNDDNGVEIDNELGIFGVGKIPLNNTVTLFGRAGLSRIETSPGGDDDGFAYGVGAEFNITDKDGIRLDATRHDYDAGEADAYSISYVRRF